jgi:hypothetical protein
VTNANLFWITVDSSSGWGVVDFMFDCSREVMVDFFAHSPMSFTMGSKQLGRNWPINSNKMTRQKSGGEERWGFPEQSCSHGASIADSVNFLC